MKDVDSNWMLHTMKVTYEDQVTNFEAIVKELSKAGFEVDSKPEYLEPEEPE